MSRMYNALKEAVQETLRRSNTNPRSIDPTKGDHPRGLTDEIEDLATIVADRIGRLKLAASEDETVLADERAHAKEVIANLSANIASLETKFNAAHGTIQRENFAVRKAEESLTDGVRSETSPKGPHGDNINSETNTTVKELNQMEAAIAEAVKRARIAEATAENSKAQILASKSRLSETEEIVRSKDATTKQLAEHLHGKIQGLECQVKNNAELLVNRDQQVQDLRLKLVVLKNRIEGMSPYFKQIEEALAVTDAQETGISWPGKFFTKEDKLAPLTTDEATSKAMPTVRETVSSRFFDRMTAALTHVLGPKAAITFRVTWPRSANPWKSFPRRELRNLWKLSAKRSRTKT